MDFIDMFCGIGTIRMGMEQAGHKCVYSIEWDKWKRKIYSIIFGGEPDGTDIRTVKSIQLPKADCWCFGFPCQDISVAGKQLGFKGNRSSLFFEVMRLLQETKEEDKPKYLFIENVKNLFSVNKGWDFFNLLYSLDEGGYDAEWQLLNSKDFGVPQNRERVFIIGHLRGRSTTKVFPITGGNSQTLKQIIPGSDSQRVYDSEGLGRALKAEGGGQGAKTGLYLISKSGKVKNKNYYSCLTAGGHSGGNHLDMDLIVRPVLTPNRLNKRQNGRRFKEPGEPMFTLTKQDIHGVMISNSNEVKCLNSKDKNGKQPQQHDRIYDTSGLMTSLMSSEQSGRYNILNNSRIRRLTPKECWRLQGIPDKITDKVIVAGISDTQMYRGAGDATTVPAIYEIVKRMS